MKKFILGLILGMLIMFVIPVNAAIEEYICYKADYKVLVYGIEYTNADLPILNYRGNTYAPFRSILETAGLNVDWNTGLRQAEVTKGDNTMDIIQIRNSKTLDGLKTVEIDGIKCIALSSICDKYREYTYGLSKNRTNDTLLLVLVYDKDRTKIFLDNIPGIIYQGRSCTTVEYYESTILPLIKLMFCEEELK